MPAHSIFSRSILILPLHLSLGLHSDLFPSGLPTKILHETLLSPIRATRPAHLVTIHVITRVIFGEQYKSKSSWFVVFPLPSGQNISLSTLLSKILSLFLKLNAIKIIHSCSNKIEIYCLVISLLTKVVLYHPGTATMLEPQCMCWKIQK